MNDELSKALRDAMQPVAEWMNAGGHDDDAYERGCHAAFKLLRDHGPALVNLATPTPAAREPVGAVDALRTPANERHMLQWAEFLEDAAKQVEGKRPFAHIADYECRLIANHLRIGAALATPRADSAAAEGAEAVAPDAARESMRHLAYLLRNMTAIGFSRDTCDDAADWLERLSTTPAPSQAGDKLELAIERSRLIDADDVCLLCGTQGAHGEDCPIRPVCRNTGWDHWNDKPTNTYTCPVCRDHGESEVPDPVCGDCGVSMRAD